jgi:lysophospholipase L1-like esterase
MQSMGGWRSVVFKFQNKGIGWSYLHRDDILQALPPKKERIIFLGDSHTQQCEWSELLNNQHIINRGIVGDVTETLLKRLPSILALQPKQIFLMIGVNDLLVGVPPATVLGNYQNILQNIQHQSPNTKIMVQSILPINSEIRNMTISNVQIAALNAALQQFVIKQTGINPSAIQQKVTFIDLTAAFSDLNGNLRPEFTFDGVHLNGKGYAAWQNELFNYEL